MNPFFTFREIYQCFFKLSSDIEIWLQCLVYDFSVLFDITPVLPNETIHSFIPPDIFQDFSTLLCILAPVCYAHQSIDLFNKTCLRGLQLSMGGILAGITKGFSSIFLKIISRRGKIWKINWDYVYKFRPSAGVAVKERGYLRSCTGTGEWSSNVCDLYSLDSSQGYKIQAADHSNNGLKNV